MNRNSTLSQVWQFHISSSLVSLVSSPFFCSPFIKQPFTVEPKAFSSHIAYLLVLPWVLCSSFSGLTRGKGERRAADGYWGYHGYREESPLWVTVWWVSGSFASGSLRDAFQREWIKGNGLEQFAYYFEFIWAGKKRLETYVYTCKIRCLELAIKWLITPLHFDPCIMSWCLSWEHDVLSSAPRAILVTQLAAVPACLHQPLTGYSLVIRTCLLPWSGREYCKHSRDCPLCLGAGRRADPHAIWEVIHFFYERDSLSNSLRIDYYLTRLQK